MVTDLKRTGLPGNCATCGKHDPGADAVRVTLQNAGEREWRDIYVHATDECYGPAVEGHGVDPFLAAMFGVSVRFASQEDKCPK